MAVIVCQIGSFHRGAGEDIYEPGGSFEGKFFTVSFRGFCERSFHVDDSKVIFCKNGFDIL